MAPAATPEAPQKKGLYFIHLSDTHITPPPRGRYGGQDSSQNFRKVIAAARGLDIEPDFFVVSGDLTDRGEAESYEKLFSLVSEVEDEGFPVLLALGNHDNRENFYNVFLGQACGEHDRYHYSATLGGLRVIVLDSLVQGRGYGRLGGEQLRWLADELSQPEPPVGTVVVVHHPPIRTGATWVDGFGLVDSDELHDVLSGHSVLGLLSGHTHYPSLGKFGDTISATAPGVANFCDPSSQNGLRTIAGSGFNLVSIRGADLAVHPVILPGTQHVLRYENDRAVAQAAAGTENLWTAAGIYQGYPEAIPAWAHIFTR